MLNLWLRTLFHPDSKEWLLFSDAWPIGGHSLEEVEGYLPDRLPENDINGRLYAFLLEMLTIFCRQTKALKIDFTITSATAEDLSSVMQDHDIGTERFDRIESSNISDEDYLGVRKTITALGPLLKPVAENPHATLLLLFMTTVRNIAHDLVEDDFPWVSGSHSLTQFFDNWANGRELDPITRETIRSHARCFGLDNETLLVKHMEKLKVQDVLNELDLR